MRTQLLIIPFGFFMAAGVMQAESPSLPIVEDVEIQPFSVYVRRLMEAVEYLGVPFEENEKKALEDALKDPDGKRAAKTIQEVLDARCLIGVRVTSGLRLTTKASPLADDAKLLEGGWRQFLIKVHNEARAKVALSVSSPDAAKLPGSPSEDIERRWLDLKMFRGRPLQVTLSGVKLEYRIIQLYSRDRGKRSASLTLALQKDGKATPGTASVPLAFDCEPTNKVIFHVRDENDRPTIAAFEILDGQGRLYPSPSKRLEPDFAFQPQVYRGDGETITLPDGVYTVRCRRGPESIPETKTVSIKADSRTIHYRVRRWVNPSQLGWWSGDHHIHAAGCQHYSSPTQGVRPEAMIRHCIGEDLNVGSALTWGPCFDHQLKFFTGQADKVSRYPYLLRYDIEVSGFGSHQSGHLCLLRLKERNYPGGKSKDHWPTLGLNTLRWAKQQGAITGPAHSGGGLTGETVGRVEGPDGPDGLPYYGIPPYNGSGANEYIVDVTHKIPGPDGKLVPAIDFISTMDTDRRTELNMWYHTLNCGFRTRASGETDFPCISGQRVGVGRVYVKVDGKLNYNSWCDGIQNGRSYVSDGLSHLMEFRATPLDQRGNTIAMGEDGSTLRLDKPGKIRLQVKSASRFRNSRTISESFTGTLTERLTKWEESIRKRLGEENKGKARLGTWYSMGPFVCDSFDEAFDRPFDPERGIDLKQGGEWRWRKQPDWEDGEIHHFPGNNCATYVYRAIAVDSDRSMLLSLGSNDAIKVWINRKLVWSNLIQRAAAPGQDMVLVDLKKGANNLLMKIVNGSGGHGFYFEEQSKARPDDVVAILRIDPSRRTKEQVVRLTGYYSSLDPELLGVEAVVNGYPAAGQFILSDGKMRDMEFEIDVKRSSWVAVRIFPSAHTNPIWVEVAGQPVRASRRSAEWCLRGVDQCWSQKARFYAKKEKKEAERAYEHARRVYRRILTEADVP